MRNIRKSIRKRESLSAVLVAALVWLPLTACGGDDDDDDGDGVPGAAASTGYAAPGTTGAAASTGTGVPTGSGGAGMAAQPGQPGAGAAVGTEPGSGGAMGTTTTAPGSGGQELTITPTGLPDLQPTSNISGELGCPGLPFGGDTGFEACTGYATEAEYVPVDIYIMLDRSISMEYEWGDTIRWQMLTDAIRQFVNDPQAAKIGVGIQFFSLSGLRQDSRDCDVNGYATPEVEIGPAAEVGAQIMAAIEAKFPAGLTPTVPALQGAIQYAYERNLAGGRRPTVALLVTDGLPTQCPDDVVPYDIELAAEAGINMDPPVRSYVIGVEAEFNLDGIARMGGTKAAFNVREGDSAGKFKEVMLNITDARLSCEFAMPPDPDNPAITADPNMVVMTYKPANGDEEEIPKASSQADCASSPNGGWYYDDPVNPTRIRVCPCTCDRLGAGQLKIVVGCTAQRVPLG